MSLIKPLLHAIHEFTKTVAFQTFPTHNVGWNAVPEEWEDEQPDRFDRVVNLLHDTAREVCANYDALVKLATRKLGIIPDNAQQENRGDRE